MTSQFKKQDIFNIDESDFFFCMAPSTSVTKSSISGRKKNKKRLTVAIATNADGSCKLPLLFIGATGQPRCFKGLSASELGVDYTNSPKGWMTTALFAAWLQHFNEQMMSEGRHALLLLDNASPHRVETKFLNINLHFLPPNATAHLQPQDAGVIQAFKSRLNTRCACNLMRIVCLYIFLFNSKTRHDHVYFGPINRLIFTHNFLTKLFERTYIVHICSLTLTELYTSTRADNITHTVIVSTA